ncbi:MAG: Re/Si-specific NAD(P)(+) transhydrogenase subunit alpha [Planctomycetales bacterium]|jgi:NAD(P) transhydrogenase subunit alpha
MSQDATSSDAQTPRIVGVPAETFPDERRVALAPANVAALKKSGVDVIIQSGAGTAAGYADDEYSAAGAELIDERDQIFKRAEIVLQVRTAGANAEADDCNLLREGQTLIGMCDPLLGASVMQGLADRGVTSFALELLPRITRAQSMDVLSSQASIAGYKAVLTAAAQLPKMCPMMMTAAGTIAPARFFVLGAGVAGLQAIATAKRLGAVVWSYDVRPAVKEEVLSLGAKFMEIEQTKTGDNQSGGYAKEMDEEFYQRQRQAMMSVIQESDVIITTAAIPGRKAPVLVTDEMVKHMPNGSIIVDLAAESGGNCALTKAREIIVEHGVTIDGTINVPTTVPYHSSQMYGRNITTFLLHLLKDGALDGSSDDEIIRETMVTHGGEVVNARVRDALGLPPLDKPTDDNSSGDAAEETSESSNDAATEDSATQDESNLADKASSDS